MSSTFITGFTPTPLSSYLSALGLQRVVAEQLEPEVTGAWQRDQFTIQGPDADLIVEFLTERWAPSPVFSPWNKEGDPDQNDTTASQLDQIISSTSPRFDQYRATLEAWRVARLDPRWINGDKTERLALWRSFAPDDALGWMDAAVALATDKAEFPPLLGSGGNDGRFEFSRLLHGELVRLFIDPKQSPRCEAWLRSLLFGEPAPALVDSTSGMYDSDAAGTPNSSPQGSAKSASNPWAIVLTFEGLIALGSSVVSRLGSGRRQLVGAPFMVRASRLGGESSPNEDVRGELWAPLWDAPATWPEVRRVISEGRLSWQGRQAASSIDAARAVACLGVDRGIHTFVRHQIAQRNGKSYLAGPVGRVQVRRIPGAADLGALDAWVRHARSVGGESVGEAARHLDRAQTAVVDTGGTATAFTEVLVALTDLERAVWRSLSGRERCQPLPPWRGGKPLLDAATWVGLINDGTAEVRLATALASLSSADGPLPSMAAALRGLAGNTGRLSWSEDANGREPDAIAAARSASPPSEVLRRRLFTADQVHPGDLHQLRLAAYRSGLWASLEDIVALTSGRVDFARMMRLARGMAMLAGWDARKISTILRRDPDPSHSPSVVDPWFAAVRLCLLDSPFQPSRAVGETKAAVHPLPRRSWGRLLVAGRFEEVGCEALSILARRGITSLRRASPAGSLEPSVAAVALLLRLSPHDVGRLSTTISDPTPQGQ